jgi:hypothetical protein
MPSNTNFPETFLRERNTSTGLETATKFKISHAERAIDHINGNNQFKLDQRNDMYMPMSMADEANIQGAVSH